jgi:flotillin
MIHQADLEPSLEPTSVGQTEFGQVTSNQSLLLSQLESLSLNDSRVITRVEQSWRPSFSLQQTRPADISLVIIPVVATILLGAIISACLKICNPNEILVLSGRKHRNSAGQMLGYRVIFGGRVFVIPVLETIKRISLVTMPVTVEVRNAYSKGGIPLHIQAIANVKVSSKSEIVGNAIERFLDRDQSEIERVARETLEGNLRGVVANLTPEEINEDRLQFAERIAQDVSRDLTKLGLQLDTLKIQSVADDVEYLRSIGRQRIAQVIRDAEIAEAEALGQAERIEAECQQLAVVAQNQAMGIVQQKKNELRRISAELEQQTRSEEERTSAAADEARAKAEQQLQTIRAELERLRLQAEQVLPAEANRHAQVFQARGQAATLVENAKATAEVNELFSRLWQETGREAADIFLVQQLETILSQAATIPNRLHLKHLQVVDGGDGQSLSRFSISNLAMVQQFLAQIDQTLGLDVVGILSRRPANSDSASQVTPALPRLTPPIPAVSSPPELEAPNLSDSLSDSSPQPPSNKPE